MSHGSQDCGYRTVRELTLFDVALGRGVLRDIPADRAACMIVLLPAAGAGICSSLTAFVAVCDFPKSTCWKSNGPGIRRPGFHRICRADQASSCTLKIQSLAPPSAL